MRKLLSGLVFLTQAADLCLYGMGLLHCSPHFVSRTFRVLPVESPPAFDSFLISLRETSIRHHLICL